MSRRVARKVVRTDSVILEPTDHPFVRFAKFPYRRSWVHALKNLPGPRWDPVRKGWTIPTNVLSVLPFSFEDRAEPLRREFGDAIADLYTHQKAVGDRVLETRRHLFAWDPGSGKTVTVINVLIRDGAQTIGIVCPAGAIPEWEEAWAQWGSSFPEVIIVSMDNRRQLEALAERSLDALVIDESHHLANKTTARHKRVMKLREGLRADALLLELSGTPITNQLYTLHAQLWILEPGAWGSWSGFCLRYMEWEPNDFAHEGKVYYGINSTNAGELATRLDSVMSRVTDSDIAEHLPPLDLKRKTVKASEKLDAILDWSASFKGEPRLIYTHRIESAHEIARLTQGIPLTGKATRKKRREEIARGIEEGLPLVATMHSVGESINDLDQVSHCAFAELWWSPRLITQSIKRVHRLSTREPVDVTFFAAEGTVDEAIIDNLQPKIEGIERIIRPGSVTLKKLIDDVDATPENFRRRIANEVKGLDAPWAAF